METVKISLGIGKNVYLRGFGSFILKKRAAKTVFEIFRKILLFKFRHIISLSSNRVRYLQSGLFNRQPDTVLIQLIYRSFFYFFSYPNNIV